jgi:hypothetical protein
VGVLVVIGILAVGLAVLAPNLLRGLGILGPDPEELLAGAKDPVGSQAVSDMLEEAGFTGADAFVFPIEGGNTQIAIITLDESASFLTSDPGADPDERMLAVMQGLSQANREHNLQLEGVAAAVEVPEADGSITLAAPQDAIDAFAAGEISQREFLRQVDIDLSELISAEELRRLAEEELP